MVRCVMLFYVLFCFFGLSFGTNCEAGLDDGRVLDYPFAGNADDASGKGKDGRVRGASLVKDRFDRSANAYRLDGFDDWIDIDEEDNGCLVNYDNDWSVNIWVYLDGTGKHTTFFAGADGDAGAKQFAIASSYVKLTHRADTSADWRVNFKEASHDTWHMYTVTWSKSGQLRVFVDGVLKGQDVEGKLDDFCPDNEPVIGAVNFFRNKTQFFKGRVDDFRIYERVLSASEIGQLYTLTE